MKQVWLVLRAYDYEGADVAGVYSTREAADAGRVAIVDNAERDSPSLGPVDRTTWGRRGVSWEIVGPFDVDGEPE